MQILEDILQQGTEGDHEAFHSWCQMYLCLSKMTLSQKFSDYQNHFVNSFVNNQEVYKHDCKGLSFDKVYSQLNTKVQEKIARKDQTGGREKFLLFDMKKSHLNNPEKKEIVFLTNIFEHEPIYFFVAKIKNWFRLNEVDERQILEASIAITEAIENAVKYSDGNPVIVNHSFIDKTYTFLISNSVKEISDDATQEELKKKDSLMRGVLIMSKLLDEFNLDRDNAKNIVTLSGKVCIS